MVRGDTKVKVWGFLQALSAAHGLHAGCFAKRKPALKAALFDLRQHALAVFANKLAAGFEADRAGVFKYGFC